MRNVSGPIGVFDSGVGGVSVIPAITALLPSESLIYCADTQFNPYGERSSDEVIARSLAIAQFLLRQQIKALVVACNTATTIAIGALRATLPFPVIGVEPGVKPAAQQSVSRVAGLLATPATLRSKQFQLLVQRHAGDCRLICTAGVGLVEAVEAGELDSPELEARLRGYLEPMLAEGVDTLALGCTHYPFLRPVIERIVGTRLQVIDNSLAVARQLARQLDLHNLRDMRENSQANATRDTPVAHHQFYATAASPALSLLASRALKQQIMVLPVDTEAA